MQIMQRRQAAEDACEIRERRRGVKIYSEVVVGV
jgi:hypothetical protein